MLSCKEIILWLWQLPQNLLGVLLLALYKHEKQYHTLNGRRFYYTEEMPNGVSLGNYIIMKREDRGDSMKHEYGHSIQSRILGPLYLIIIGLPSGLYNLLDRFIVEKIVGWERSAVLYYRMPWEHWADRLGRVHRYLHTV